MVKTKLIRNCKFKSIYAPKVKPGDMVWWNGTVKGCDTEFALVVKVKEQNNLTFVFVLTEDGNCGSCGFTPYQSIDVMIINET